MKKILFISIQCMLITACTTSSDIEEDSSVPQENQQEPESQNQTELRSPKLWPFTKNSIWNMPIGSDAIYQNANFKAAGNTGVDTQHIIITKEEDPIYTVLESTSFASGRCSGTEDLGFDLRFPKDLVIADAGNSSYGGTPNSNFALLMPDGESLFESSRISRCAVDGPIYLPSWHEFPNNRKIVSIKKSEGVENSRGQGASGMSALGGTIRLGELTGKRPLRHAIKINPWAEKYVFYSDEIPGYKWPAVKADSYAPERYNKNGNPNILMGSLFAIPVETTVEEIGIVTAPGKILFEALQKYGMYFVEDADWNTWDIIVEEGVNAEFRETYGFSLGGEEWENELNTLMQALHVITNNTPESIGGGGTPIAPLAPDFKE